MPIYEYKCQKCGHITEFLESMSASGKHACESCKSLKTEKILSSFATSNTDSACPSSAACPSGDTCSTGQCPFS